MTVLSGCVKRTIVIESDPPGASVWINEHPVGTTPLTQEFITHGRYKFRLEKPGFQELIVREMVRAPLHQWIPIDFLTENLIPFHFRDRHHFKYMLSPESPSERLRAVQKSDVALWVSQLKDPNLQIRRNACVALARQRDPATADALLEATHDPDSTVRAVAMGGWRGIEGKAARERLSEALLTDPNPEIRWQAAIELEALADRAAVPVLLKALHDRSALVRTGAAEALKTIADPESMPSLIWALRDRDTSVRRAATEGLGRIGDHRALRPLTKVLFHHDVRTRRLAAKSLAMLKDPAAGPALVRTFTDEDKQVRRIATEALIDFGDARVIPRLIRYLRGLKPWTREHAARALGGLKDQRALEPLARAFRREPDPPASQAMYDALKALGARLDESWSKTLLARQWRKPKRKQPSKPDATTDSSPSIFGKVGL